LEKLIARDEVFTAGPVLYELLQGIRSPGKKKEVKEALLSTNYLEMTSTDWGERNYTSHDRYLNRPFGKYQKPRNPLF